MKVSKQELVAVLAQFNPWWRGEAIADLPAFRRAAFRELYAWLSAPPAPRAVLLSGARQIGKTTLLLQAADALLRTDLCEQFGIDYPIFAFTPSSNSFVLPVAAFGSIARKSTRYLSNPTVM